jgi:hypothetical protein
MESRDQNLPHILSLKSKLNAQSRPHTADSSLHFTSHEEEKRQAWGNETRTIALQSKSSKGNLSASKGSKNKKQSSRSGGVEVADSDWASHGGKELLRNLPVQTSIPVCLHQIIDTFVRRILPWQVRNPPHTSYTPHLHSSHRLLVLFML